MSSVEDLIHLARRIERANAGALAEHAEISQRLFPEVGAAAISVGGGVASFVGADVPVSYAVGLGMNGPVAEEEIERLIDFYRSRGVVPRVDVCPFADESLMAALRKHGFRLHWFVQVLSRPIGPLDEIPPQPEGISVRQASSSEGELWTEVVDAGFSDGGPLTPGRRQLGLLIFNKANAHCYFAEIEGRPVAAGVVFMTDGYGALAATSVLPEFRGRGAHAALIRARMTFARDHGCDRLGYFASPGTISQYNAERHGFRVVYTKAVMKFDN